MKKLLITILLLVLLIMASIVTVDAETELQFTISEVYIPSEVSFYIPTSQTDYIYTEDEDLLLELVDKCEFEIETISWIIYNTASPIKNKVQELEDLKQQYLTQLNWVRTRPVTTEYPIATECWKIMKGWGWNSAVCAGVLGNMMAETGGQTLNIQYDIGSSSYYGLCQWSLYYSPSVYGMSLQEQLEYLKNGIEYQLNTYGWLYAASFNYKAFSRMTDPAAAALAFSKCYERNTPASYGIRMINAETAYNYFVN